MLALCIFYWVLDAIPTPDDEWTEIDMLYVLVGGVMLGLQIYFGIKGNELSGKNMLENGWQFADPDDHMTTLAKEKWRIQ